MAGEGDAVPVAELVKDLDALRAAITKQAGVVKQMKKDGAKADEIQVAVKRLKELRAALEEHAGAGGADKWPIDAVALEQLLKNRMFVVQAFDIYGGVAGLFDFGPPGCSVKDNVLSLWKQWFILEESMLQLETTTLTPHRVLDVSGHVSMFSDLMAKDVKTGECYRADKLLEDFLENKMEDPMLPEAEREDCRKTHAQADAFSPAELHAQLQRFEIKAPATGNDLTEPFPFNLMFQTSIGPGSGMPGYMRPETAQGIFVNFRRLLEYNSGRMPFAGAQIGLAYRNEISPRGGLLRVREFCMAEIEHFVDPRDKSHPKFATVAHLKPSLFPGDNQVGDGKTLDITLGEAVERGIIGNETLAYFMGRTYGFMMKVGIKHEGFRFRQHLRTEMAHYASDCWDAEILMSSGWVECVGHADRACFDLENHMKASGVSLEAARVFDVPREVEVVVANATKAGKGLMGKEFKKDNKAVQTAIAALCEDEEAAMALNEKLQSEGSADITVADGRSFTLTKEMLSFEKQTKKVSDEKYLPHVIEPSFGIGRILTGIFEHSFSVREDAEEEGAASGGAGGKGKKGKKGKKAPVKAQRNVLSFRPAVAPVKVCLLNVGKGVTVDAVLPVRGELNRLNISSTLDTSQSASIGRRYARADELGIPFCITVDSDTATDGQVTIRDRDTVAQIRLPISEVAELVRRLSDEVTTFSDVVASGDFAVVQTEGKAAAVGGGAGGAGGPSGAAGAASTTPAPRAPSASATTAGTAEFPALALDGSGRFARPKEAILPESS